MQKKLLCLVSCLILSLSAENSVRQGELIPLPAGAIKPEGWLKTMSQSALAGYTGNIEKINQQSRPKLSVNGWSKVNKKAGRWAALEQEGYYLDGAIRLGYILNDSKLITKIRKTIDIVVAGQQKDGYFFDPALKNKLLQKDIVQGLLNPVFTTEDDGEEASSNKPSNEPYQRLLPNGTSRYLWSIAVFNRAVLALYDSSNDEKYLNFLVKFYHLFANSYKREVPPERPVSGTELHFLRHLVNLEVLFETAERAGDNVLREKGLHILQQNESGMVKTWLNNDFSNSRVCHGVTFNELFKLYVTPLSKSHPHYLQAVRNAYEFLKKEHGQAYGVNSANEYLCGIGGFQSTELCDVVDLSWSLIWLSRATGEAKLGDDIENAFFNAFPAAVDKYQQHVYVFGPNRLPGVACSHHRTEKHDFKSVWAPQCCTGNLNRALPNFIMHMTMKTPDNGLAMLLYGPNKLNTQVNGVDVSISNQTDYPFKEDLSFSINPISEVNFPLYLRIPQWCKRPVIQLNGDEVDVEIDTKGFVKLKRNWQKGDRLKLHLPMNVELHTRQALKLVDSDEKPIYFAPGASRIDSTAQVKAGAFHRYVTRGPLLFALPLNNNVPNKKQNKAIYNYALAPIIKKEEISVNENTVKGWVWDCSSAPVTLELPAYHIDWSLPGSVAEMPQKTFNIDPAKKKRIKLIPFGSAKYRLTLFPAGE